MPVWLLKFCHLIGLTNLTDEEVARYERIKRGKRITFTSAPIVRVGEVRPVVGAHGPQLTVTCANR